ncbi:hypothetical protein [Flavobacterium macacae]|uniref:Uncharacterized protein n=1 Tax=Flavobacterium macacae TaxID=2488993 RepID=A0A3P3W6Z7_9FLAO|nr:hypothetical protein [Flavobacterium macacae]RRJ90730.1 hypothetical protein EG849_09645 [Flavobacterium macacae]
MIRSPHSAISLDKMALAFEKDISAEFTIKALLAAWPPDELKPVMTYLHDNLHGILTDRPAELEDHIGRLQPLIDQAKADYLAAGHAMLNPKTGAVITNPASIQTYLKNWVNKSIRAIFNYDNDNQSFISKDSGRLAYRHARHLKVDSCPYCNANFTFTIKNKRMKCRPQFDHFLNKGRHPYLALSFFNLIPSCALCNSGALKGSKPFSITTHVHPFLNDMEGLYNFRADVDAVDFLVNGDDFTLVLKPCKGISSAQYKKAQQNIKAFGLDDRYSYHKDIASDVIKKAYFYNKSTVEALFTSFQIGNENIFKSESEIKELILGNYMHPDNFHKRILSKLTKDIAEEFGLTI